MKRKIIKAGERVPVTPRPKRIIRYDLHLSPSMHERLSAWARNENRSLHAQIIHVLTEGYKRAHDTIPFVDDEMKEAGLPE